MQKALLVRLERDVISGLRAMSVQRGFLWKRGRGYATGEGAIGPLLSAIVDEWRRGAGASISAVTGKTEDNANSASSEGHS